MTSGTSSRSWSVWLSGYAGWFDVFAFAFPTVGGAASGLPPASAHYPTVAWLKALADYSGEATIVLVVLGLLSFVIGRWTQRVAKKSHDQQVEELVDSFDIAISLVDEETISAILSAIAVQLFDSPDRNGESNKDGQLFRLTYHRLADNAGNLTQTVDYVGNDNFRAGKGRTIPARMGVTARAFATRSAVWESLGEGQSIEDLLIDQGFDQATRVAVQQDRRFWAAIPVFHGNREDFRGVVYCDSNDAMFLPENEASLRVRYLRFAAIILAKYEATAYELSIDDK